DRACDDRKRSTVVVDAATRCVAAVTPRAAVAARGLIAGDGAVGNYHGGAILGKDAAALTLAAVAQGAAVAADHDVAGDGDVAAGEGAPGGLVSSAPGAAALGAAAASSGNDGVAGERAVGYCHVDGAAIEPYSLEGPAEGAAATSADTR